MAMGDKISGILIFNASLIVFFLLDILDGVLCVLFRFVDKILEGRPSSCYCSRREELGDDALGTEVENTLSESLHGRKSFVREIGLLNFSSMREGNTSISVGNGNRWSDCGCEACVSWMRKGSDSGLHVVVKQEKGALQNVIFIHGFLLSSSIWKETVFPNLSHHSNQKYNLYAIDLLGFGNSPKPRDCFYTLKDHLDMIEKSVIDLYELKEFHLVANSMGCVIALALAARFPASVKSIYLVAPPYFSSSSEEDVTAKVLNTLAPRRIWPLSCLGAAAMSWYEHIGRCVCFFICRNHRTWERFLRLVTREREVHFLIMDMTRHTHHSAWHTMHNVICGGAKNTDKYLGILRDAGVRIQVVHGMEDQVVPVECSLDMKMKFPEVELKTVPGADHNSVIFGRELEFTQDLEMLWASAFLKIKSNELQKNT